MTNEIKKLYKNVGLDNLWVERYDDSNGFEHENWYPSYNVMIKSMMEKNDWTLTEARNVAKKECHKELLPFTAEKQISLIIFLSYNYSRGLLINLRAMDKDIDIYDFELFGECLARLVNNLWQDLNEEEKQQIKEILK